jgi:hypothetical protein
MANINATESQALWDNRFESCKCYNSETQDASSFQTYRFGSRLDGVNYYVNSASDGVTVAHDTDAATIEANIKAYLETLEKKVLPVHTEAVV